MLVEDPIHEGMLRMIGRLLHTERCFSRLVGKSSPLLLRLTVDLVFQSSAPLDYNNSLWKNRFVIGR